jgi:hypothetical protein
MKHAWKEERCMQGFGREIWGEGGHLEDPGMNGRIILKWILEKWYGGVDRIDMAQDRDRWSAVVNAVTHIQVP